MTSSFSERELDTLQEIMNMAFGHAAADLAEVVDVFIHLNTPRVEVITLGELPSHIAAHINDFARASIVEQHFRGQTDGVALLVFPRGAEKELLSFFQPNEQEPLQSDIVFELEQEVLMEIGNILIGACVGRLFELLKRSITYLPPRVTVGGEFNEVLERDMFNREDFAITMRTQFSFEDRQVSGHLFLINRQDSAPELQKALAEFWSQFE